MKKTIITSFIAGILLTAFLYHAYTVYTLRNVIAVHEQAISQIVTFINNSIKANDGGSK